MSVDSEYYEIEINQGFAGAESADFAAVRRHMALEQEWQADEPRFATNADIEAAYRNGDLELIEPSDFYRPIRRLLPESRYASLCQPYLKPGAADALLWITGRAHDYLMDYGIEGEIRYPVTSLVRSMERQAQIASKPNKLALSPKESGHPTGWDFDIDSSSYYLLEDGQWKSVSRRKIEKQRELNYAYEKILGSIAAPTVIAEPDHYDPRVRLALHYAAAEFYAQGVAAPVVEYANTPNELIHFGVNPKFFNPR